MHKMANRDDGPASPDGPAAARSDTLAGRAPRDPRLDVFRGIALVMIFINHVPGTMFEHFTNRNWGFSDAAEGFVLMSGMAAGIAYASNFTVRPLWPAIARVWARARTLYFVHLATTFMAMAILAAAALYFDLHQLLITVNMRSVFEKPLHVMIGIPTLGHQLGYFNILPLYCVLLLATPFMIMLALRRPMMLLALSIICWALAGQFRFNIPAYPNPGGWFFNPFSWQLIFVFGLLIGMAMKQGKRLVPILPWLVWASGLFLLAIFLWRQVPAFAEVGRAGLAQLGRWGVPFYLVSFDKTFEALPRLLHIMALAYFLSTQGWVKRLCATVWASPFALLGQHSLAVFATGSVLSILGQAIKAGAPDSHVLDTTIIMMGLALQLLLAWGLRKSAHLIQKAKANRLLVAQR